MRTPSNTSQRRERVAPVTVVAAVALVSLTGIVSACGTRDAGASPAADTATPVRLADVLPSGSAAPIAAIGTLGAKDEVTLSFKIGGIVARVLVDDGARVRRGQVLATLDQREIDAIVAKATVAAEKTQRDAERAERLFRDSVVTLAQLQDAQSGRDAAAADLRAARVNHEYATIVAPGDGVVLSRVVNAGQLVSAGAPVIQFASNRRGQVLRAGLPDRDAIRVHTGMPATVAFEAVPERSFAGRVSQVGAAADPRTGTYLVEVQLTGAAGLPSGLVGRLTIGATPSPTPTSPRAADGAGTPDGAVFAIPAEALVEGDGDHGVVFTVDAASTHARRLVVTLVGLSGDKVLVRGLDGVNRVVSSGATWLTDSARVEVKP